MGIRYYAYAFDGDQTEKALADPLTVIGSDPLANAWGLEPGFTEGVTDFRRTLPEQDFLYLDKAWTHLQRQTAPRIPGAESRAAYRMFEGQVTQADGGSWRPWVRALPPGEVALVASDLQTISDQDVEAGLAEFCVSSQTLDSELAYVTQFLHRATDFTGACAAGGRGLAYLIG